MLYNIDDKGDDKTNMDMKMLGDRIKERRQELDVSAEVLADRVGLNKATIHRYENGFFKSAKIPVIESIAYALRCNPDWLIGKSEDKTIIENLANFNGNETKDINEILSTTKELLTQDGLMFGGQPVDDDSIQSILAAMEIGIALAKKKLETKQNK